MNLKFLIVLVYYKRPNMVLNALQSIKQLSYENWQLDFIDDSGDDSFRDTLMNFGLDSSKINYLPIFDTEEQKKLQGGSRHGEYMNKSIYATTADVVIVLCDDDALTSDFLTNLNSYYTANPDIMWSYSKVKYFNPIFETYHQAVDSYTLARQYGQSVDLNKHDTPINPDCACDSSQVTFRRRCYVDKEIKYPYPQTRNLDSAIYNKMYQAWGPCYPTFFYGQCKGVFDDQLGRKGNNEFNINVQ
jgi:hypothetical protein